MIPKNINRNAVLKAIDRIEQEGIPKGRESKKYNLRFNNKNYPPKYIISLANAVVNGLELEPREFSGGKETNSYLTSLGFEILSKTIINDNG